MVMGGKERTEADFRVLFDMVGLEVVTVNRAEGVAAGVVEGRLKRRLSGDAPSQSAAGSH